MQFEPALEVGPPQHFGDELVGSLRPVPVERADDDLALGEQAIAQVRRQGRDAPLAPRTGVGVAVLCICAAGTG